MKIVYVLYVITSGGLLTMIQAGEFKEKEQHQALMEARQNCYEKMATDSVVLTGVFCPRQFDNILCWPDSTVGKTHKQYCPSYITRFKTSEYAYKTCLENGTWYFNPETNNTWTNFSNCIMESEPVSQLIQRHMPRIKLLSIVGYSASLATLVLAVFIMLYFRKLRCPRNLIHVNLFLVYIFRAFISLLKQILLVQDIGFPMDVIKNEADGVYEYTTGKHWECKIFFTVLNYTILTSIVWIFMEGLYLHLLLSYSVHLKKIKIRWFMLFGWGCPVIFAVIWALARYFYDDNFCWNVSHDNPQLFWIIRGPIVSAVVVTFLIFVNILRLLCTKLTAKNCPSSRRYRYRRLAKSTLILIPLFAVYYMGFIWLPSDLEPLPALIEMYIEMLFNSFQGMLVALLFCFLNAEVQNEIRKKWNRHALQRSGSVGNNKKSRKPYQYHSESETSNIYTAPKNKNKDSNQIKADYTPLSNVQNLQANGLQDLNDNINEFVSSDVHMITTDSNENHGDLKDNKHRDVHSSDNLTHNLNYVHSNSNDIHNNLNSVHGNISDIQGNSQHS